MDTLRMNDGRIRVVDDSMPKEVYVNLRPASGFLGCTGCRDDNFCRHIEYVIVNHLDSTLIGPPNVELVGTKVSVPLVPKHKQWADVYISDFHKLTESYYLNLVVEKEVTFIGFMQQGEGRAVFRSMVYDWFRTNVSIPMLKCSSTSHAFKQEVQWGKHTGIDSSAADQFAEYWSVWKTKMCLMCNYGLDFSDVVPDDGKTPVPW